METPKFKLSNLTEEEQKQFMADFEKFLAERSVFFEPVPQFIRDNPQTPWKIVTQIWLQHKTEIVEVEKDSVISPIQKEDLDK